MQLSPELGGHPAGVKLEPPGGACLLEEGHIQQQYHDESPPGSDSCGPMTERVRSKEEPRDESSNQHPITVVKTEPYDIAISGGQDQMGHSCDSNSEETQSDTCVLESPSSGLRDLQLREMELSPKISSQRVRVKSEPLDAGFLPEQGQQQQRNESALGDKSYGATQRMCHIRKEPPDNCSDEHQIIQVKTEPYNTALFEERDQTGHSQDSTSEGAKESRGRLHINDEPRDTCDQASSRCTSSNAQFEISTTTTEALFDGSALITTDGRPTEQPSAQSESQEAGNSSTFTCHTCFATFSDASTLQVHAKCCTGEGLYKAMVLALARSSSAYKCNLCPAESSDSMRLQRHSDTHTSKKPYKCDHCNVQFTRNWYLLHHKRKCTGEKPYKCDLCPAEFSKFATLRDHKRTHTNEKPYKCGLCPARFTNIMSLSYHKRKHTDDNPCKCDLSTPEFGQCTNPSCHKQKHMVEKLYKCDLCTAEFTHRRGWLCHKRRHTGERPYKCDVCIAAFSSGSNLSRHKRIHTGETPYKCNLCPAEFNRRTTLVRHNLTHTGIKPHKCDLCPAAFINSTNLQYHKRKHRREALTSVVQSSPTA